MEFGVCGSHLDPRVEDVHALRRLSRRGFLGGLIGGSALGSTLLSFGGSAIAGAPVSSIGHSSQGAAPDNERYWDKVTRQFLIRKGISYMNTGTRGPSPRSVQKAQIDAIHAIDSDYFEFTKNTYNKDFAVMLRGKLATFVGAKPSEIALTSNTTEGMIFGTLGLKMNAGDEMVYTNHDHPSGGNPILLRAARERLVPRVVDLSDRKFHPSKSSNEILAAVEATLTPKTKLLSFSHINYTDGCIMPVKAICDLARAKGVITLVDGAQVPGMMKLDVHDLGCDMYAGACHKWLLGALYTGFFYVREEIVEQIWPTMYIGAVNGKTMYGAPPPPRMAEACRGAGKFDYHGSHDFPSRLSVNAALDFHTQLTPAAIEARDRYLAQRLRNGLRGIDGVTLYTSDDPSLSCALVAFTVRGVSTTDLVDMLWNRHRIYIRNITVEEIGWDVARASLHIMVTAKQVDTLVGAIAEISGKRSR